ncbi:MAG: two-component regulator propeller domain-containing protein, partial [Sediminibacterium sp.]
MRFIAAFLIFFMIAVASYAQPLKYSAFTVNDGLPSNYIYRCVEDDKGFLWVATDAGIARFDGKRFQVFTTHDGLPDNEVLSVVKEENGRIWANCFKQSPAYFDELQNRFINAKEDISLAKISGTGVMLLFALRDSGMVFYSESGSYIIKKNKSTGYCDVSKYSGFLIRNNGDGSHLVYYSTRTDAKKKIGLPTIFTVHGRRNVDSLPATSFKDLGYSLPSVDGENFYLGILNEGKCLKYSSFAANPLRFKVDSFNTPEPFFFFSFTADYVNFYGNSGKVYVYDKKNLQLVHTMSGNYAPDHLYNDSKGNIWISTIDKGLIVYKKKQLNKIDIPETFSNTNFLSISRKPDGGLLAGNYYGEVIEGDKEGFTVHPSPQKTKAVLRQRKIIISQNKVFTFSEMGVFINYKKQLFVPLIGLFYGKTAISYNDSIIIVGNVGTLIKLNSRTESGVLLYTTGKRVTAIAKTSNGMIYYGSTDGLYKYDYAKNKGIPLDHANPLLNERIVSICITPDGLVWLATSGSGVIVVKDDKVLYHILDAENTGNNSSRCIVSAGPGKVWVGTQEGINMINYDFDNKPAYTIQHISVNDGLTNNVVNDMVYERDTVYAATADGISVIPTNTLIEPFNIPVQLTGVSINQRDTIVTSFYKLGYDQKNIQMQFAGIELNGHFKNLQYTLDQNEHWIDLKDNTLTIILNSGLHSVKIRAVDVNGNISGQVLMIQFDIATPFWKAIWFWLVTGLVIQVVVIYLVMWWYKKKKQEKLSREIASVQTASLEQQAFTSLMNPHFMFNALNSIQHYINLQDRKSANRYLTDFASLIRKNFEGAQQSFIPLEQELEN